MVVPQLQVCSSKISRFAMVRMLALCTFAIAMVGCVGQSAKTPPPAGQKSVSFSHVLLWSKKIIITPMSLPIPRCLI